MNGPRTAAQGRFWAKVQPASADECWLWTAYIKPNGYGSFRPVRTESAMYAHRYAYELLVADIPDGLVIDHLCRVRHCVNPYHLEPVTIDVNNKRGRDSRTHCRHGHEYDAANTYWYAGKRQCRRCRCVNQMKYERRQRAVA